MPERRTPSSQGPGGQARGGRAKGAISRSAPARRPSQSGSGRPLLGRPLLGRATVPGTGAPAEALRTDQQRSGTRPATARRAATPGTARRTSPPTQRRLTGRATALGLVLLALMLAYAYPVRLYLAQEAQIQALQTAQAGQRARIKSLTQQSAEWNDPAYIAAQARARFYMVPPGTKTYVVQAAPIPTAPPAAKTSTLPWYGQLWSSIRSADDPGAHR